MNLNPTPREPAVDTRLIVRGVLGAVAGAGLGYAAFYFLLRQNYYAMVLPGALVGFGAALAMQREYRPMGFVSAAVALILSFYLEWRFVPFIADKSLGYFLAHLHQIAPVHLLMIAFGTFLAYWFGVGRSRHS